MANLYRRQRWIICRSGESGIINRLPNRAEAGEAGRRCVHRGQIRLQEALTVDHLLRYIQLMRADEN